MLTVVGILTFISGINTKHVGFKAGNIFLFSPLSFSLASEISCLVEMFYPVADPEGTQGVRLTTHPRPPFLNIP